jgi:Tol biopolymer transport system component/DNA-binding winged helix-turn-helix (wHTH) protein
MVNKSFVFRFDDVEVREREFTVIKAAKVLTVEPKAFRALLFLLRNQQRVISKEELLNSVWGDVAVADGSLTRCIWLLRRLLEDDINNPRYIATVATVGYKFVCSVEMSEDTQGGDCSELAEISAEAVGGTMKAKPPDGAAWSLPRWWLLAAVVLVVGLVVGIWYLRRPLPMPRISKYNQITHDGHEKYLGGTDGSRIYFFQGSLWRIAEVGVAGGEIVHIPVAVPGTVWGLNDVSPDGSNFLIESHLEGNPSPEVWIVRIPGGSVHRLGDLHWDGAAAFSPDAKSVALPTQEGDIYLIRSDGTDAHKLTSIGGQPYSLAWSPDSEVIRVFHDKKIWEISSSGSGLHELIPGWHASSGKCCGRWTPDGRFYVFLSPGSGSDGDQIWALDERRGLLRRPPGEPVQLTSGPLSWGVPIPGKEGKFIFAEGSTSRGELSRFDAKTKEIRPFLGGISVQGVTFSKDGQSVAYVSYPEGILWKANRDGSNPMQMSAPSMNVFMPRWSPDGTQILFSDIADESEAYTVTVDGGIPRKLLPEGGGVQADPDWSPDGSKIAFCSSFGGHEPKSEIRIFDLASRRVTTLPGSVGKTDPRWSPDGRSIAANSSDLTTMNIFDIGTQRWSALPPKFQMTFPEWSSDSHFIYFMHVADPSGVYRISVNGGEPQEVVNLKNWHIGGWASQWDGLDPTDAPLLLRDIGSSDIYALTLEEK